MVTSCTPKPIPATNRQMLIDSPVLWNAITAVQPTYHRSDPVNAALRPKRSATAPSATTPTQRPAKVENTNVPTPATRNASSEPNQPSDSGVNKPLVTIPG